MFRPQRVRVSRCQHSLFRNGRISRGLDPLTQNGLFYINILLQRIFFSHVEHLIVHLMKNGILEFFLNLFSPHGTLKCRFENFLIFIRKGRGAQIPMSDATMRR